MEKRQLSERDICTKFITPALERSGWDIATQIREEFPLTKGRIIVRGRLFSRARNKRADYVLFLKPNLPIAVIEAKDNTHTVGNGMQQALGYAALLDVPFAFSSNGDGFLFHNKLAPDGIIEREIPLDAFPGADQLWRLWAEHKGLSEKQREVVTQDYYSDGTDKTPRYYQLIAINKTVEAIARGDNRILLVMAKGSTSKTHDAWARNLYSRLCRYSHARGDTTDASIWKSNGPIYSADGLRVCYEVFLETYALMLLLAKWGQGRMGLKHNGGLILRQDSLGVYIGKPFCEVAACYRDWLWKPRVHRIRRIRPEIR